MVSVPDNLGLFVLLQPVKVSNRNNINDKELFITISKDNVFPALLFSRFLKLFYYEHNGWTQSCHIGLPVINYVFFIRVLHEIHGEKKRLQIHAAS